MPSSAIKRIIYQSLLSILVLTFFIIWAKTDIVGMRTWLKEDGLIENLSSVFFGLSSIALIIAAKRSSFLKNKSNGLRYFMILSWALLMFIFMGEEISWGQRLFDFNTPESLAEINDQDEFNIHNIEAVDSFMGGKYRYLSIMMITTGLILPVIAISERGKKIIQLLAFPVAPVSFGILFIGAYIYGKVFPDVTEAREFLLSVAMLFFSINGAMHPNDLFRVKKDRD